MSKENQRAKVSPQLCIGPGCARPRAQQASPPENSLFSGNPCATDIAAPGDGRTPPAITGPFRANRLSRALALIPVLLFLSQGALPAGTLSDRTLADISFDQKLNQQISLNLPFVDETGRGVRLGQYFGRKPVILVMGYYECPMLCSMVLNGMVEGLEDLKWTIGKDFEVVNVSINPRETSALASAKKRNYLKRYGRAGAEVGWHFLTGSEEQSKKLADQVGFQYVYDPASKQYAHPSGLVVLTPEGKVSGYLFGVTFKPKVLYAALSAASVHQITSPIQKLVLLCFHYNPITGKYGALIMTLTRLLALATLVGLGLLVVFGIRRKPASGVPSAATPEASSPAKGLESVSPSKPQGL